MHEILYISPIRIIIVIMMVAPPPFYSTSSIIIVDIDLCIIVISFLFYLTFFIDP